MRGFLCCVVNACREKEHYYDMECYTSEYSINEVQLPRIRVLLKIINHFICFSLSYLCVHYLFNFSSNIKAPIVVYKFQYNYSDLDLQQVRLTHLLKY